MKRRHKVKRIKLKLIIRKTKAKKKLKMVKYIHLILMILYQIIVEEKYFLKMVSIDQEWFVL